MARSRTPETLKAARESAGYPTQESLAVAIRATEGTVSKWEKGESLPRGEHLERLGVVLAMTGDEILAMLKRQRPTKEIVRQLHELIDELARALDPDD